MKKTLFCSLILSLIYHNIIAQSENLSFKHINTKNGLSHSSIHCIYQDKLGFMWFGTEEGLNRYDGYDFKIYKNISGDSTSLSDDYVTSICEDDLGIFWIGTRNGLNSFNPATGSPVSGYTRTPLTCPGLGIGTGVDVGIVKKTGA